MPEQSATMTAPDAGAYELIRARLETASADLMARAQALNSEREAAFGGSRMALAGSARIRTENNCIPRDIAHVGGQLLFGYNVYIGLKSETRIADVFSLHAMDSGDNGIEFRVLPLAGTFLDDAQFKRDFAELYGYYKDSRLTNLRTVSGKLLAVFATGRGQHDVKVFRWRIERSGAIQYLDNRGERDNRFPPSQAFEWRATTRDHHVAGHSPHVSVDDQVFVDTIGGNLTVKVENNTDDGEGIYNEPVDDDKQTLSDADIEYARAGSLIILKIRPYREQVWRYLVYNPRSRSIVRLDAIGGACQELPEDQGIIFPGGYYLVDDETRVLDTDIADLTFQRSLRSPNGEDVLYVFHHLYEGRMLLLSYNVIAKSLQNPIECHGYSFFDDGHLVVFRFTKDEPTRVHTMQVWETPYTSDDYAAAQPAEAGALGRIGNADLVRGISDAYSIHRLVMEATPSVRVYEDLIRAANHMRDAYHWLNDADAGNFEAALGRIREESERIVGEFEKVEALREQASLRFAEVDAERQEVLAGLNAGAWTRADQFVDALGALNRVRGRLISLKEIRYMDLERVSALESEVISRFEEQGAATAAFLADPDAMAPYHDRLDEQQRILDTTSRRVELKTVAADLEELGEGLDLLNQVLAGIAIEDTNQRTAIVERISEVYARLNRERAQLELKSQELGKAESKAEFAAQFLLFSQTVTSAISLVDTPERAEEQLSRLLVQLEELEGRFGEFDDYLSQLAEKREEVYGAFEGRRQSLLEARQRRARGIVDAAARMLEGIERRAAKQPDADALNAYFAADPMVTKLRDMAGRLRELDDGVAADDVESKLKALREQSGRALRDRRDMFDGDDVIRLGRHRFHVASQNTDLGIVPSDGGLILQLAGTDFAQPVDDPEIAEFEELWSRDLVSESEAVYRGEYLAAHLLRDAHAGRAGLSIDGLRALLSDEQAMLAKVRGYATPRYQEGYERGVHDADAAAILAALVALDEQAGLLRVAPRSRAIGLSFAVSEGDARLAHWRAMAASLGSMSRLFSAPPREAVLMAEMGEAMTRFAVAQGLDHAPVDITLAAEYLLDCLAHDPPEFVVSAASEGLAGELLTTLETAGVRAGFEADLAAMTARPGDRFRLALAWLEAYTRDREKAGDDRRRLFPEVAALLGGTGTLNLRPSSASVSVSVTGLLGNHPRITERRMSLVIDEFSHRLTQFVDFDTPRFAAYRAARHALLERERAALRLEDFKPKALTTFVRNRLIDEVYLPIIGDNLAKQMGALGDAKRTDLMGILLLISPPGYGKTTLMEYVAQRLGLIFMKINCPSIGHAVTSVDPRAAADATARQELEKLNLAFEMGNNVMIYLDDIQHTNPEFLQKFISMGDAQRKIEGVWRGRPRTYDLRGKRVCLIMAGNPYTESGQAFSIPDMLANRADIYNLGDVLGGREDVFAMSYLENALTANPVLAPLANRDLADVYRFVRLAQGENVAASDFDHDYAATEREEIVAVLLRLLRVREVVLAVNQAYIASAAQADAYRTEPPFKLQGSYRNMNKMAEKVVAVMDDDELEQMIDDHYQGEAQTLTSGAEENLLKLRDLRGVLGPDEARRWRAITSAFARRVAQGDAEDDPAARVVGQLVGIGQGLAGLQAGIESAAEAQGKQQSEQVQAFKMGLEAFSQALEQLQMNVQVVNQPVPGMQLLLTQLVNAYDQTLLPLLKSLHHKLSLDESIWRAVSETSERLKTLDRRLLDKGTRTTRKVSPTKKPKPRKKAPAAKPDKS